MILQGDCREVLATLDAESIDACVTDPPYELGFMGKAWDRSGVAVDPATWAAVLRVLKPGAHLLAFGGTRTYHRMACAIEDAGFEIRDQLQWLYGSGFPKSLDVSKAIDKAGGATREVIGRVPDRWTGKGSVLNFATDRPQSEISVTGAPATEAARQWEGWGTALKPANEPICLARKPLVGTVAANVLEHGAGALNIDGCRIVTEGGSPAAARRETSRRTGTVSTRPGEYSRPLQDRTSPERYVQERAGEAIGRWPANVLLDDEAARLLDEQSGVLTSGANPRKRGSNKFSNTYGAFAGQAECIPARGQDAGGASRFFYCAKPSKAERGEGNTHPTVKPIALLRYLLRLVTPPGGVVLDPFAGSGTTLLAARNEGFEAVGIELNPEYIVIAERRARGAAGAIQADEEQVALELGVAHG